MSVVSADLRILQGAEGMEIHSLSGQPGSPGFIPFLEMLVVLKMSKMEIYGPLCFVPCLFVCCRFPLKTTQFSQHPMYED